MDALYSAQDEARGRVLIDGDMDFAEATERLRKHNELDYRRDRAKARKATTASRPHRR
jgi:hypothetical protein